MNLQTLAVGGGAHEFGVDFQQGRAHDAARFDEFAPGRHAAFHKEVERRGIHPLAEVGKEDDACRIAVAELHVDAVDDGLVHEA